MDSNWSPLTDLSTSQSNALDNNNNNNNNSSTDRVALIRRAATYYLWEQAHGSRKDASTTVSSMVRRLYSREESATRYTEDRRRRSVSSQNRLESTWHTEDVNAINSSDMMAEDDSVTVRISSLNKDAHDVVLLPHAEDAVPFQNERNMTVALEDSRCRSSQQWLSDPPTPTARIDAPDAEAAVVINLEISAALVADREEFVSSEAPLQRSSGLAELPVSQNEGGDSCSPARVDCTGEFSQTSSVSHPQPEEESAEDIVVPQAGVQTLTSSRGSEQQRICDDEDEISEQVDNTDTLKPIVEEVAVFAEHNPLSDDDSCLPAEGQFIASRGFLPPPTPLSIEKSDAVGSHSPWAHSPQLAGSPLTTTAETSRQLGFVVSLSPWHVMSDAGDDYAKGLVRSPPPPPQPKCESEDIMTVASLNVTTASKSLSCEQRSPHISPEATGLPLGAGSMSPVSRKRPRASGSYSPRTHQAAPSPRLSVARSPTETTPKHCMDINTKAGSAKSGADAGRNTRQSRDASHLSTQNEDNHNNNVSTTPTVSPCRGGALWTPGDGGSPLPHHSNSPAGRKSLAEYLGAVPEDYRGSRIESRTFAWAEEAEAMLSQQQRRLRMVSVSPSVPPPLGFDLPQSLASAESLSPLPRHGDDHHVGESFSMPLHVGGTHHVHGDVAQDNNRQAEGMLARRTSRSAAQPLQSGRRGMLPANPHAAAQLRKKRRVQPETEAPRSHPEFELPRAFSLSPVPCATSSSAVHHDKTATAVAIRKKRKNAVTSVLRQRPMNAHHTSGTQRKAKKGLEAPANVNRERPIRGKRAPE